MHVPRINQEVYSAKIMNQRVMMMSYHGAVVGATISSYLFSRRHPNVIYKILDVVALAVPVGFVFGRIGNFLNQELVGRATDVPWGIYVQDLVTHEFILRHPSQLYEFLLEGVVLFLILWSVKSRPWQKQPGRNWPHGSMLALFLILYGCFRCLVELVREPDPQLGRVLAGLTMGQVLSLIMIAAGILLWLVRRKRTDSA